jgi:hypothetical protein
MKCSICNKDGHNKRSCKAMPTHELVSNIEAEPITNIETQIKVVHIPTEHNLYANNYTFNFTDVMTELIIKTPKDKKRKVCKNCNELGHITTSTDCKLIINKHNILKHKIKNYILSKNCLENKNYEDYCAELSIILDITPNLCKSIYNDIPLHELLHRQMDINAYIQNHKLLSKKCYDCKKNIVCTQTNTHRIWKGNDMCDSCWCKYEHYRKLIWENIKAYKKTQCEICRNTQTHVSERFHYDHLNMFNKGNSICSMVNDGIHIEEIYSEIDKCHILCLPCHHIVTDIEHKIGFTRIKQTLTRKLNQSEITEEEYNEQTLFYQKIYEKKMEYIYKELNLLSFSPLKI